MKFKKEDWYYYGIWVQAPLSGCFWTQWYLSESIQKVFPGKKFNQLLFLNGHTFGAVADQEYVRLFVKDLNSKNKINDFIDSFEKVASEVERDHLSLLEQKHLEPREYLNELFRTYRENIGIWVGAIFDSAVTQVILEEGIVKNEEELFSAVDYSARPTWLQKQSQEIKKIAKEIKEKYQNVVEIDQKLLGENSDLKELVENHVEEFKWFGTHHWEGEGYSIEKCLKDINDDFEKESLEYRAEKRITHPLLDLLGLFIYWRTHCAEVTSKAVFESRSKLEEAGKTIGKSYEELIYLSNREILEILKNDSKNDPENYKERVSGYGCFLEDGKEKIVTGEELKNLISDLLPKESLVSEIKGIVASKKGIVRGMAKVVLSPKDFSSFQKGDVLVAPETTPDFVPLMKLALAIVTEAGGVTSHAAIVSRELGVPCVIGTKISTRVIKSGDRVEVDSDNGIVKILNND